jgi:predicted signal transduction protein with EAL and GGDEF domain
MADPAHARQVLKTLCRVWTQALHRRARHGTGYASLSHIIRLPLNEPKVDRSFIATRGLDVDPARIVRSTVDPGHNP